MAKHLTPLASEKDFAVELLSLRELAKLEESERRDTWRRAASRGDGILWLGAIIDPSFDSREIMRINYELPLEALEEVQQTGLDSPIVTFGSALEVSSSPNPYLYSKLRLARSFEELKSRNAIHIRTHTLVSHFPPPAHMFLGQLFMAAKLGQPIVVKSPRQVREYVSTEDFARFIVDEVLVGRLPSDLRVMTVGNGDAVEISRIAEEIMREHSSTSNIIWGHDEISGSANKLTRSDNDLIISRETSMELVRRMFRTWMASH